MGCCEARHSDPNSDLRINTYLNYGGPVAYKTTQSRESIKMVSKTDLESVKTNKKHHSTTSEIPKTREVKVPTVEIPIEIIKTKKRLNLTIFESKFLTEGTVLNITPGGLEGSERMARDGVVIFGTKNDEIINDFNFPDEDIIGKRHFEIKYDISKDCYKIKNLFGSGLFIKINKKFLLRNNSIFSFSTSHLIVKISMDNEQTEPTDNDVVNSTISLKVIHGVNEGCEYVFDSKNKPKIKLGRIYVNGVDVAFGEESTSRLQCTIFYENNNWYIVDGDGVKQSLNGTWYLADEYMDIYEKEIFRAGTTSFQAHLYDP